MTVVCGYLWYDIISRLTKERDYDGGSKMKNLDIGRFVDQMNLENKFAKNKNVPMFIIIRDWNVQFESW